MVLQGMFPAATPRWATTRIFFFEVQGNAALPETARWLDGLADEEALTELGIDRARLMRHVDVSCIVPPYESLYVGKGENDIIGSLNDLLAEAELGRVGIYRDAADYLGLEMALLAELCELESVAQVEGRTEDAARYEGIRARFLAEHVNLWVPQYAANMHKAAKTGFYKDVAAMMLDAFPKGE